MLTLRMHARHNILNDRKYYCDLFSIMTSLRPSKMSDIFTLLNGISVLLLEA